MATVLSSPPPVKPGSTRKPRVTDRTCRLVDTGTALSLVIWQLEGRKETTDTYAVRLIPSDIGGRGVEVAKQGGETYHVLLNGEHSTCECKGFLRWGHCRHVESLTVLDAAGKL